MAKQTSIIKLQGTVGNLTYVSSRTYGEHARAKRGTHKPAPVNAILQQESKRMLMANVPAKLFKDAIDQYRDEKGGSLWRRLLSNFRGQLKAHGRFDFSKLIGFEIDEKHPLQRMLSVKAAVSSDKKKSKLKLEITYGDHPNFRRAERVNGYMLSVISVFPDLEGRTASAKIEGSTIRNFQDAVTPLIMQLDIPPMAKEYMICLKIVGCEDGVVTNLRATMAFCVIAGGEV